MLSVLIWNLKKRELESCNPFKLGVTHQQALVIQSNWKEQKLEIHFSLPTNQQ